MNQKIRPLRPLIIPLVALIIVLALIYVLKDISPIDDAIIAQFHRLPTWLLGPMTVITTVGSSPFDVVIAGAWAFYEYQKHRPRRAVIVLASLIALPIYGLIKLLVHRARPVTEYVHVHGLHDYSFPSGHTTASAAVYGTIAVLAASGLPKPYNRMVATIAIIFAVLVGCSRIYLGAHFPSDVLGGWLIALMIVSILRTLSLAAAKRDGQRTLHDTTEEQPAA